MEKHGNWNIQFMDNGHHLIIAKAYLIEIDRRYYKGSTKISHLDLNLMVLFTHDFSFLKVLLQILY